MASKALAIPLLLAFNLLFFAMVSSYASPCPPLSSSKPKPTPSSSSPSSPSSCKDRCPIDVLKLGVCANVLNLVNVKVGAPPALPCCNLLKGLIDLEAASCLCTALKANVLGINLNIPVSLSVILNNCGMNNSNFQGPMFLVSTSKFQFP